MLKITKTTVTGKVIPFILLAGVIAAIGAIIIAANASRTVEPETEFFILNQEGRASGYPSSITVGNPLKLYATIVNHEYKDVTYWLKVLDSGRPLGIITDDRVGYEIGPIELSDGEKWEKEISLMLDRPGNSRQIQPVLYLDGSEQPYLSLLLWLNVLSPGEILDQQQISYFDFAQVYNGKQEGQTFQAGKSGELTRITLRAFRTGNPPSPLTVELRDTLVIDTYTVPGNKTLATASRADIASAANDYDFDFSVPPSITAGNKYAIVVKTHLGDNRDFYSIAYESLPYLIEKGNESYSEDGGSSWTVLFSDLYFRIVVRVRG